MTVFLGFAFTPNEFYERSVIAAKNGGLTVIIEEGKSGFFLNPVVLKV
jgi:hypothetical protein